MMRALFPFVAGIFAGLLIAVFFPWGGIVDLRSDLADARAAATGQAAAFDASEDIRKGENASAIVAVSGERQSCEAQIAAVSAVYERALIEALQGDRRNENVHADPIGGRNIRPPGGVPDNPAMGED